MKNIIKIIFLAIVSVALAIVVEQLVAAVVSAFWQREIVLESYMHFTWFLAFSAIIEEISKYWAVYFVIRNKFGMEKIRFVLASLFLGTLWGVLEIGLVLVSDQKVISTFRSRNPEVIFFFATVIALHALAAYLMGVFISAETFSGRLKHLKILFFPVLIHLLFNFLIIQKSDFTNYLVVFSLAAFFLIGTSILALSYKRLA
ncbi:MAG: hypothetical protein V1814_01435 [Candidatus Moraniibacteriota bacterium]